MNSTLMPYTKESVAVAASIPVPAALENQVLTLGPDQRSRLVFLTDPVGLAAEQYKILRRRHINLRPQGGVLLITSPGPGEGKTLTAVNLSWALADSGERTCLVDLDFRAPGVSQALGCSTGGDGIEDVLTGRRKLHQAMCQIPDTRMHVLRSRSRKDSPGSLLSAKVIVPVLAELRSIFHWVILDFAHKATLVYKYGCSDGSFNPLGGVPLLFWKVIQQAHEAGIETFDLGRSGNEDPGLIAFKEHLGAETSSLTYFRSPAPHSQETASPNKVSALARHAVSHLPDPLFAGVGQLLYRHMA